MIEIQAQSDAKTLIPSSAIVLYEPKRTYSHSPSRRNASYATVHDVSVINGVPQLGAGVAVARDGLMALFQGLDPQRQEVASLTQTRVLTQGSRWMVWWCPPSMRRVWFNAQEIGEKSAEVPLPGLVFAVTPSAWYVFAMKSGRRPGASTKLYQAPFYNVYREGNICVGTMQTPQGDARRNPAAWERAFFESYFTHSNVHGEALVSYKGGATAFWKAMLRGKKFKTFPKEVLVDRGVTIQKLLDVINRSLVHE